MIYQHRQLASGKWCELSLVEQLANIGSEVERTISWRSKNPEYSRLAFERALELIDLTLADKKNRRRCKEIARIREVLGDYFLGGNEWSSTDELWRNYFYPFNFAARAHL
ncbi:MAG: hypothetical protein Q7S23_05735 [bacterium]|nr:hypothetical protein [bacterium]